MLLLWSWISYMEPPSRSAYGFAYNFPYNAIAAGRLPTILAWFISRETKWFPFYPRNRAGTAAVRVGSPLRRFSR